MTSAAADRATICEIRHANKLTKRNFKLTQSALKRESKNYNAPVASKRPSSYRLEETGGQWYAHGGGECAIGDTEEQALYKLQIRLNLPVRNPVEKERNQKFLHSLLCPTCDVLEFTPKADVDGKRHYLLDFTSSVDLLRGDIERLFPAMLKRETGYEPCYSEPDSFGRDDLDRRLRL